jgi:hypothetical protein
MKLSDTNNVGDLYPALALEWHPSLNGNLKAKDVTLGSGKIVWWKCSKCEDHVWQYSVRHRVNGSKCPFCRSLGSLYPNIAIEWHPTLNNPLTSTDVSHGSKQMIWWKCLNHKSCDEHVWQATVNSRVASSSCCPYCIIGTKKVCTCNSFGILYPNIAIEWHTTMNGNLKSTDVSHGSKQKIWWICKNPTRKCGDNIWQATINSRVSDGKSCPICATSHGEKKIHELLTIMKLTYEPQYKIYINNILKIDFAVFYLTKIIMIEFDGGQHFFSVKFFGGEPKFNKQRNRDLLVDKYCKDNKLDLIRIPYWDINKIQEYLDKIYTINDDVLLAPSSDYYTNIQL